MNMANKEVEAACPIHGTASCSYCSRPEHARGLHVSAVMSAASALRRAVASAKFYGERHGCLDAALASAEGALRTAEHRAGVLLLRAAPKCEAVAGDKRDSPECGAPATYVSDAGHALCDRCVRVAHDPRELSHAGSVRSALKLVGDDWRE